MRRQIRMLGAVLLSAAMLTGCGAGTQVSKTTQEDTAVMEPGAQEETSDENVEQTAEKENTGIEEKKEQGKTEEMTNTEQTTETTTDSMIPEVAIEPCELPESEALSFVRDMKIGWNLGNTLDASSDQNKADELAYESDWCGIVTTKEMIDEIKAAGYQTLRVPVSWHNHVSDDGSYTISQVWMDRVQEVVDYGIDNGMYVILNIHHDNNTSYMYPSSEYQEQSEAYIQAIWNQVAERFAEYDEHLIMEALNEPRLVGTNYEWWLDVNNQDCIDALQRINGYNQVFVDTVRATGGKNATRYLLVPGYAASLQGATNSYFELPEDIQGNEGKILVEVHAYTPYNFALQGEGESGSTDKWSINSPSDRAEIDNLMNELYNRYTKNGIGVVIDEFGARDKGNNTQARTEFATYYIAAARSRGITCCWWDNNAFSGNGENFGLLRRRVNQFLYPEIVEGMMKYSE